MGAPFWGGVLDAIIGFATSYALNAVTNKLFGKKQNPNGSSPTYSIGALQTTTNSNNVMPIIYGKVKCAGNNLWQTEPATTVQRLVGFGVGKNKGVSDVRLDDIPINAVTYFTISYTGSEEYGRCRFTSNVFSLTTPTGTNTFDCTNKTGLELITWINSFSGWQATSQDSFKINDMPDINSEHKGWGWGSVTWYGEDCTNTTFTVKNDGLPGCSYAAYMGDGVQQIDSRVTGDTQEAKAKLVGGMKYDAALALTITGSTKISSNPNLTAIWEGRIVKIYSASATGGYTLDLKTGYYYKEDWSDNVWCVLDFMTSIDACGMNAADIDIQSFITAAAYAQPEDGKRRWSVNLILDNKKSRQDWLDELFLCFRAYRTYQKGKHGILIDKPEPVSQVFKVKPTESIQIDWQELSEDVERIILKYRDPDYEWQNVGAPATITTGFRNAIPLTKTIEVNGITNFKQASQHAWFYLNQAQTCGEYITYTCNKRAINRTIGDVIGIFDPITQVTEPGLPYKRYRIMAMTEPQGIQIQLYCREYNEALYGDTQGSVAPVVSITKLPNTTQAPAAVTNLTATEFGWMTADGVHISNIDLAFTGSNYYDKVSYIVTLSSDEGNTWRYMNTISDADYRISGVANGAYIVGVQPVNKAGIVGKKATYSINVVGKDQPPSNVPSISATISKSDCSRIVLTWPAVTDIDLKGYKIYEGSTVLTPTPISDTQYTYTATSSRQHTFSVYAVDNSGNPSATAATLTMQIIVEPAQVAGFSAVIQETDRSKLILSWSPNSETDISYYEVRTGNNGWDSATVIATQLKATSYIYQMTAEGSQTYMVKAVNVSGHYSAGVAAKTLQIILRPDAPTNLKAVQEPRDRSMVKVSWTASPGKDIAGYELRYGDRWDTGTVINTAADCQYWWYVPASGTYNIMIKAKTVAGYYSNVANVSITVMIEPYDVTGFTAVQSVSDRTKVTLQWDNPLSQDVSYFIIKKGASWDTGTVITTRATGTFYDTIVKEETPQTFWIKAVSTAGHESQNPASTAGIFNMNPSPVSNIQIAQQANDKSVVEISWVGVSESDLVGYQVAIGYVWETAEKLPLTQELKTTYSPAKTGDLKAMIKSVNAAGYYSDEVSNHKYITLEPAAVTGFQVLQNGENVEFFWDKHPEPDVVAYEIREGSGFEAGTLIDTGITLNSHKVKVDVERNYRYHIKAINRSNRYSQTAVSQTVYVSNLPPKNVILEYDEISRKDGTLTSAEFGESLINFSNIGGKWRDYPTTKFSDVGGKTVLKLLKQADGTYAASGEYVAGRIDVGKLITANISIQFVSSVVLRGFGSARLQIRTSRNGTTWTEWQDFRPAEYTFQYLDRRVLLTTSDDTKTPEVNQFITRIDVDDLTQTSTVDVPVGGISVLYSKLFYVLPITTGTAIGENRFPEITNETVSGHSIKIVDRAGNDVGGKYNYSSKGY